MKPILYFGFLAVAASLSLPFSPDLDEHWEHFKNTFKKSYIAGEEAKRRFIWERRVSDITHHNLRADLGLYTYRRGLNKYSDLSHEEYMRTLNGFRAVENGLRNISTWLPLADSKVPDEVDWRDEGLVTPIKDQGGRCGGCWAFSATGSLEGQHKRKTGELVSLSEQNLLDCVEGNNGCSGGDIKTAFEYVKQQHGIDTEDSYPYEGQRGICQFDPSNVGCTCTGYGFIPFGDEEALKQAVATIGPISVGVDAHHESFHDYKNGIFDEPDCGNDLTDLTHALLVVGYGTADGEDYWMVKNSWGESFGLDGYIMMSRNKNNQCGIASIASYPIL